MHLSLKSGWTALLSLVTAVFFVLFVQNLASGNIEDFAANLFIYGIILVGILDDSKNSWIRWSSFLSMIYFLSNKNGLSLTRMETDLVTSSFVLIYVSLFLLKEKFIYKLLFSLLCSVLSFACLYGIFHRPPEWSALLLSGTLAFPLFLTLSSKAKTPSFVLNISNTFVCLFLTFFIYENRLAFDVFYDRLDEIIPAVFLLIFFIGLFLNKERLQPLRIFLLNLFSVAMIYHIQYEGLYFMILLQFIRLLDFSGLSNKNEFKKDDGLLSLLSKNPFGSSFFMSSLIVLFYSGLNLHLKVVWLVLLSLVVVDLKTNPLDTKAIKSALFAKLVGISCLIIMFTKVVLGVA